MEDLIDEAALGESDDREVSPPPKKKRKTTSGSKKKKTSKKKSKETEIEEENEDYPAAEASVPFFRSPEDMVKKKELEILLLRNPNIDVSNVLKITNQVDQMTPEQVEAFLEAANRQLDMQCPFSSAENLITLASLALQKALNCDSLFSRLTADTRLLAAVQSAIPSFGARVGVNLEILGRTATHVWEAKYSSVDKAQ